jgi:hypothetical protein
MANGYRPDTKVPGHHQTVIQSLPKTISLPNTRVGVLDSLRAKRNLSDYTGKEIDTASLAVAISEARSLLEEVIGWLGINRPQLF